MKLSFHSLWFYICLIGTLSISMQEMPSSLIAQLEDSNSHKKETTEKEFRKEEEEENEEESEEDSIEDTEIEEELLEYAPNLSAVIFYFEKIDFTQKNLLNSHSNSNSNYSLQNYPPFYILFACLKIDC